MVAVFALCVRDATDWVGRPFPGFLFGDNRVVFSIGRPAWRASQLRRVEWAQITAVDGKPVTTGGEVHAATTAAGAGGTVTYMFRRGTEVFRLAMPVLRFTWGDFMVVFAPMLGVGAWFVAVSAAFVVRRPESPEVRALFVESLAVGLVLITSPDTYGPYRFTWLFFLALAAMPPAILQLTVAILARPERWPGRLVAGCYLVFAALGATLVARRSDPSIFLPLLYLVYCALANVLLLYAGALVTALVAGQRSRMQVILALVAILASAVIAITVLVTYPLRTEPVSVPWFILPLGLWPLLSGIAFVRLASPPLEPGAAA